MSSKSPLFAKLLPVRKPKGLVSSNEKQKPQRSKDLDLSRESFAKVLSDRELYAEFRQKFSSDSRCSPLLLFRDGYLRLESLLRAIAAGNLDINRPVPLSGDRPSTQRFLSKHRSETPSAESPIITVPDWLSTLLGRFQQNFILPGTSEEIVALSAAARESVNEGLRELDQNRVSVSALDAAADEVHEALYVRWYPEFLSWKRAKEGISDVEGNGSDANMEGQTPRGRAASVSSEESLNSGGNKKSSRWRRLMSPKRSSSLDRDNAEPESEPEPELQYTREGFIRVLYHPELYAELVDFAKDTLCLENIMFYEAYIRLELQIAESLPAAAGVPKPETGLTRCLLRFLENNAASPTSSTAHQYLIPPSIMNHVLLFYSTFIMPCAQHEVNITHAIRRRIITQLQQKDEAGVPAAMAPSGIPITVFDAAVDEILDLLYRNTFHLFLKNRAGSAVPRRSDSAKSDVGTFVY